MPKDSGCEPACQAGRAVDCLDSSLKYERECGKNLGRLSQEQVVSKNGNRRTPAAEEGCGVFVRRKESRCYHGTALLGRKSRVCQGTHVEQLLKGKTGGEAIECHRLTPRDRVLGLLE